jgi:hypothetical protein
LIRASYIPPEFRPPILNETHRDWTFFRFVERAETAYFGKPPVKVDGNARLYVRWYRFTGHFWQPCAPNEEGAELFEHPLPIPDRGEWWRGNPDFYAVMTETGWYMRHGYRWDDIDGYYQKPSFTIKKF